ncbi:DUF6222 family protein [Amycolatopsis sp.]|jgi:hypothetical protein|uniref:DUF6222 family protein n=1 Tax=Amycolatopsis sp. TaxID=37632 RepID=UPI002DFC7331|nr:DUF6222 family protein [Amycolatopsis sp.]
MTTENPVVVATTPPETVVAEPVARPNQAGVPRLAHGLVWSEVVAEMERDHEREQLRRAA